MYSVYSVQSQIRSNISISRDGSDRFLIAGGLFLIGYLDNAVLNWSYHTANQKGSIGQIIGKKACCQNFFAFITILFRYGFQILLLVGVTSTNTDWRHLLLVGVTSPDTGWCDVSYYWLVWHHQILVGVTSLVTGWCDVTRYWCNVTVRRSTVSVNQISNDEWLVNDVNIRWRLYSIRVKNGFRDLIGFDNVTGNFFGQIGRCSRRQVVITWLGWRRIQASVFVIFCSLGMRRFTAETQEILNDFPQGARFKQKKTNWFINLKNLFINRSSK